MAAEKLLKKQESKKSPELKVNEEKLKAGLEKMEREAQKAERNSGNKEKNIEKARTKVEKAIEKDDGSHEVAEKKRSTRPVNITTEDKKQAFAVSMKNLQSKMSAPSRAFSKVIHNPVVDKASEVGGKTVARPSSILGGAVAAVLGSVIVFYSARSVGFSIPGGFMLIIYVLGAIIGVLVEMTIKAVRNPGK